MDFIRFFNKSLAVRENLCYNVMIQVLLTPKLCNTQKGKTIWISITNYTRFSITLPKH